MYTMPYGLDSTGATAALPEVASLTVPVLTPEQSQQKWLGEACAAVKHKAAIFHGLLADPLHGEAAIITTGEVGHGTSSTFMRATRAMVELLSELSTVLLSPQNYYELYVQVFSELQQYEVVVQEEWQEKRESMSFMYEYVQYTGAIVPRLYLLVVVGAVWMETEEQPALTILHDLLEMLKGVQQPTHGIFLRHFLLSMIKNRVPGNGLPSVEGAGVLATSELLLKNFDEMVWLWIRMEAKGYGVPVNHDRSSTGYRRTRQERDELRVLVGMNVVRLSQLEGVSLHDYATIILPQIIFTMLRYREAMAQQYIFEVIVQVFSDDYHLATLDQLLEAICSLVTHVDCVPLLLLLVDRLRDYADVVRQEDAAAAAAHDDEAGAAVDATTKTRLEQMLPTCIATMERAPFYYARGNDPRFDYDRDIRRAVRAPPPTPLSITSYVRAMLHLAKTGMHLATTPEAKETHLRSILERVALKLHQQPTLGTGSGYETLPLRKQTRHADARASAPPSATASAAASTTNLTNNNNAAADGDGATPPMAAQVEASLSSSLPHLDAPAPPTAQGSTIIMANDGTGHLTMELSGSSLMAARPLPPLPDAASQAVERLLFFALQKMNVMEENNDVEVCESMLQRLSASSREAIALELCRVSLQRYRARPSTAVVSSVEQSNKLLWWLEVIAGAEETNVAQPQNPSSTTMAAASSERSANLRTVAQMLHLLHHANPSTHLRMIRAAHDLLARCGTACQLATYPTLVHLYTTAARRLMMDQEEVQDEDERRAAAKQALRNLFDGEGRGVVEVLVAEHSLRGLPHLLATALAADACQLEELAYDLLTEALSHYQLYAADAREQMEQLVLLINTLLALAHMSEENYEVLATKLCQYSAKLVRKADQARMIGQCANLFAKKQLSDEAQQRIMECLVRSTKIARHLGAVLQLAIYVDVLNLHLHFFAAKCACVDVPSINAVLEQVREATDRVHQEHDVEASTSTSPMEEGRALSAEHRQTYLAARLMYRNTIAYIRSRQSVDSRWEAIDV